MPIEIREVVIRAVVDPENAKPEPVAGGTSDGGTPDDKMIEKCVEAVMEILRQEKER